MGIAEIKSERIEVRMSPGLKALLQRAAGSLHKSVTEFLLEAGVSPTDPYHLFLLMKDIRAHGVAVTPSAQA